MNTIPDLSDLLPQYETTLPFSEINVTFSPFKVKDAKNISIVLQEENKKLAFNMMIELLKSTTKGANLLDLCVADLEFLFLQVRSKSVDERLNLLYNQEKVQVYIFDIKHRNSPITQTVEISKDTHIVLETPTAKDLLKLESFDKDHLIKACIKKIIVKNEIYYLNKFITKELHSLIDNLPLNVLPKIEEFLKVQPELYVMLETKDGQKEVSGFLNFFTYR